MYYLIYVFYLAVFKKNRDVLRKTNFDRVGVQTLALKEIVVFAISVYGINSFILSVNFEIKRYNKRFCLLFVVSTYFRGSYPTYSFIFGNVFLLHVYCQVMHVIGYEWYNIDMKNKRKKTCSLNFSYCEQL